MNISCKDNENFEFERRIDRGCGFNLNYHQMKFIKLVI